MHMNYWTIIYPFLLISSAMLKKLCELFGAIMSIIFSHVSFHSHFPISHIFSFIIGKESCIVTVIFYYNGEQSLFVEFIVTIF